MSYDVSLEKRCRPVEVDKFCEGGTYAVGGIDTAELNITYNYGKWYWKCFDTKKGLMFLNNKKAKDCIRKLEKAVKFLGTKRHSDYWKPTKGNCGYALNILLKWAKDNPDAIFKVG
jgi:hypothetical protein